MKLKANTILFLVATTIAVFLLLFIARNAMNNKIEFSQDERSTRDALEEMISAAGIGHPVFNDNLKGKTIVVNVWATWCGPCRGEIPELNKLVNEFRSNNIVFVALDEEGSSKAMSVMEAQNIRFDYQLLFSQKNLIDKVRSFLLPGEPEAIPINMVINSKGKIKHFYIGSDPVKLQEMRNYLALINER